MPAPTHTRRTPVQCPHPHTHVALEAKRGGTLTLSNPKLIHNPHAQVALEAGAAAAAAAATKRAAEFAAFQIEMDSNQQALRARFQAASDVSATALSGGGGGDDTEEGGGSAPCDRNSASDCTPTIAADGNDITVAAPGGTVHFKTAQCAAVDLCQLQGQFQVLADALFGMGSD